MMRVRFVSLQEAVAFIAWLNFQGITRGDVAAALESDFEAALLRFRAEQERRAALWLELLESAS